MEQPNRPPTYISDLLAGAISSFQKKFSTDPAGAAFAPGRVNVIGEHTDYNDGFVMPIALKMGTIAVGNIVRSNSGGTDNKLSISLVTTEQLADEPSTVVLTHTKKSHKWSPVIQPISNPHWVNYVIGSIAPFSEDLLTHCSQNGTIINLNLLVSSSVPVGAGLSSSASLQVATFYLMHALFDKPLPPFEKAALVCLQAEHKFAKLPCGIMDQMVSAGGRENKALLIDCRENSVTYVPLPSQKHAVFVIADTGVQHQLATSEYRVRRQECENAAKKLNVQSLREFSKWPPQNVLSHFNDVEMKRARHVVTENDRCLRAAEEMTRVATASTDASVKAALCKLGTLMTESHESLKNYYAVSCEELDTLVLTALSVSGVFGSRMTGGGFGGSTVTLADPSCLDELIPALENSGAVRTYVVTAVEGACVVDINSNGETDNTLQLSN